MGSSIDFSSLPNDSFALKLDNNTGGAFRDDQVFIRDPLVSSRQPSPTHLVSDPFKDLLQKNGAGKIIRFIVGEGNAFGRELAAALNRGVAENPAYWREPSKFFQTKGAKNDWVEFWHAVSLDKRAYGMGFDDAADQSSVAILPVEENVSEVRIGIGW